MNKLNNFDNDNVASTIHDTIGFSKYLSLAYESLEERNFFFNDGE